MIAAEQAITWAIEHWQLVALVAGLFVEFTPAIKLNPIRAVLKWIGTAVK